jgi:hypothetical protein
LDPLHTIAAHFIFAKAVRPGANRGNAWAATVDTLNPYFDPPLVISGSKEQSSDCVSRIRQMLLTNYQSHNLMSGLPRLIGLVSSHRQYHDPQK